MAWGITVDVSESLEESDFPMPAEPAGMTLPPY